eukprot:scaffold28431_cov83-Phaeocystis_antarctica.AAC.1
MVNGSRHATASRRRPANRASSASRPQAPAACRRQYGRGSRRPRAMLASRPPKSASTSTRGNGGAPIGAASFWECRAAQSRQARPEELGTGKPSWGTTKGAL